MAKHMVKCKLCNKTFDANLEEWVKVSSNRYAHKVCYDKVHAEEEEAKQARAELEEYICNLFNYAALPDKVEKQIANFIAEKNYTYKGILRSLVYFYEVKNGNKEKAYGKIGIVPYVYDDAARYYLAIMERQETISAQIKEEPIVLPTRVVVIKNPERKPIVIDNAFSFLDSEGE